MIDDSCRGRAGARDAPRRPAPISGPGSTRSVWRSGLYDDVDARGSSDDRRPRRRSPARAPASCRDRRDPPGRGERAGRVRPARRRARPGLVIECRQPDSAGPRPRIVVGRDRGRNHTRPRCCRRRRRLRPTRRRCGWPPRSRAIRTTWRRACSAGSRSPGRTPCRCASGALAPSPRVHPVIFVPDGAWADRARPRRASGDRAARGRGRQRRPGRAPGARADAGARAAVRGHRGPAASGLPGAGHAGDGRAGRKLRAAGIAAVVSGAGPSVLALAAGPGSRARRGRLATR